MIGPEPTVTRALAAVAHEKQLDAAVLDINLAGVMAFSVAEALLARGVPFVVSSGYGDSRLARDDPQITNCEKPVDQPALLNALRAFRPV